MLIPWVEFIGDSNYPRESPNFELNVSAIYECFSLNISETEEKEMRIFSDSTSPGKENILGISSAWSP